MSTGAHLWCALDTLPAVTGSTNLDQWLPLRESVLIGISVLSRCQMRQVVYR
jgi:hypothetical protein